MKRYSAKLLFTAITFLIGICPVVLNAQGFAGSINGTWLLPKLTELSGHLEEAQAGAGDAYAWDLNSEFRFRNGVAITSVIGWQHDKTVFADHHPTSGSPIHVKHHYSFTGAAGVGYGFHIAKNQFFGFANVMLGFGVGKTSSISKSVSRHEVYSWSEPQTGNSGNDTLDLEYHLNDLPVSSKLMQLRTVFGIEFRREQLFLKTFVDIRKWLNKIAEFEYSIERSDTYYKYQFDQSISGHVSVRPGYIGMGIGVGWYFNKSAKS